MGLDTLQVPPPVATLGGSGRIRPELGSVSHAGAPMFRSRLARLLAMFAAAFLIASTAAVVTAAPASAACSVPGTILSTTTGLCYNVPPGSYQPSGAGDNTYGLTCPLPGTTAGFGSTSSSQCNVFPSPGSYATTETLRRRRPLRPVLSRGAQPLPTGDLSARFWGGLRASPRRRARYIAFSGATSSSQASLCPPGTWSGSGASSCTDAPPGYRSASSFGSSSVVACSPGTTSPGGR